MPENQSFHYVRPILSVIQNILNRKPNEPVSGLAESFQESNMYLHLIAGACATRPSYRISVEPGTEIAGIREAVLASPGSEQRGTRGDLRTRPSACKWGPSRALESTPTLMNLGVGKFKQQTGEEGKWIHLVRALLHTRCLGSTKILEPAV